jgi:GNAT superfamily N-acetyltransferase
MRIHLAESDDDARRAFPVMRELRTHLAEEDFPERVARQRREGYRLALLEEEGRVRAVAGYRIQECLSAGRHLYVDDLVTAAEDRSRGYGAALFEWLVAEGRAAGCRWLRLDSAVHRFDAHRFYLRQRMSIRSHHFMLDLEEETG